MPEEFDAEYWEDRYAGHEPRDHPPSPVLAAEVGALSPGTALEAGCGEGANAVWLAAQGWRVTAVDVSATALGRARERAAAGGAKVAERIEWVHADLTDGLPAEGSFDLVTAHYVHPTVPLEEFLRRLAAAVVPGGTLLVVDHDHADEHAHTHASPADLAGALDADGWQVEIAERRTREVAVGHGQSRTLHDSILRARRLGG